MKSHVIILKAWDTCLGPIMGAAVRLGKLNTGWFNDSTVSGRQKTQSDSTKRTRPQAGTTTYLPQDLISSTPYRRPSRLLNLWKCSVERISATMEAPSPLGRRSSLAGSEPSIMRCKPILKRQLRKLRLVEGFSVGDRQTPSKNPESRKGRMPI